MFVLSLLNDSAKFLLVMQKQYPTKTKLWLYNEIKVEIHPNFWNNSLTFIL